MTQSRDSQVSLSDTPYYHCISRCVRRAFLCGTDNYTSQNFEHRRQWMIERIRYLTDVFSIEVCAYAIMSNHYHLVLHVNESENKALTDEDVCMRWCQLYSAPPLIAKWLKEPKVTEAELMVIDEIISKWRERLIDISWYMRGINEFIARKANKEDKCKGRFWEGRFKSQALLDEKALLTCMAYVDLNPIRAKMAASVDESEYTSIFERIHNKSHHAEKLDIKEGKPLVKFIGAEHQVQPAGINFSFIDYLELVDWTGRVMKAGKRGAIPCQTPALLGVLGLDNETWFSLANDFGKTYHGAIGSLEELALFAEHTGKRWISGKNKLRQMYH